MNTNMEFLLNTDVSNTPDDYTDSFANILAGSEDPLSLPNEIDFTLPSQLEPQAPIQACLPTQLADSAYSNNLVLNDWQTGELSNHNLNDIDLTTMLSNPVKQHSDNDSDSGVYSSSASCNFDTSPRSKFSL